MKLRVGYALAIAAVLAAAPGAREPEAATGRCSFSVDSRRDSVARVHPIPRGCVWLARLDRAMPTLRVRQRDQRGRWHEQALSFPVPAGYLGVCAANTGLLVVAYPYVTFAAGERESAVSCSAELQGMAIWVAQLSPAPRIGALWRTSR